MRMQRFSRYGMVPKPVCQKCDALLSAARGDLFLPAKATIANVPGNKGVPMPLCSTTSDYQAARWLDDIADARPCFKSIKEGLGHLRLAAVDFAHQPTARKQSVAVGAPLQQQL